MKKVIKNLAVILSLTMFFSCSKTEEPQKPDPKPTPTEAVVIDKGVDTKPTLNQEGGKVKVSFTATENWIASVINTKADSWISLDKTSGSAGSATITITVLGNDTPDDRSATVQIKAGKTTVDIVVSQKGKDALTATASKNEFGPEGGELTVEVKANIDFTYSIAEGCKDWVSESATKYMKTTTLKFNIAENEDLDRREGAITVKSTLGEEEIKIYQSAAEPTIIISQSEYSVKAEGETIKVEVRSNVNVGITIPADYDWIKEEDTKAFSTNTFYLNVLENDSFESRTAKVIFKNTENELAEEITVIQAGRDTVHVESISLDKTELELTEGDTATLVATILPENADNQNVSWSSSNTDVVTISSEGKITAVNLGDAIITVRTLDGGFTVTCRVIVIAIIAPEAVDLGLSVKWASFNLCASKPEEYGGYYQWAGLKDVSNTGIYLDWANCPYHIGSDYEIGWTKYIDRPNPDNKTLLDYEDDVAYVSLGDKWRIPTFAEWNELIDNCIWTWTDNFNGTGVSGYIVTSRKANYTDKSIFLPAAGCRDDCNIYGAGSYGYYWSSSLYVGIPYSDSAYGVRLDFEHVGRFYFNRYRGLSIRSVKE